MNDILLSAKKSASVLCKITYKIAKNAFLSVKYQTSGIVNRKFTKLRGKAIDEPEEKWYISTQRERVPALTGA